MIIIIYTIIFFVVLYAFLRDYPNPKLINSKKIIKQNCKDIFKYLEEGDKEGLRNMFCNKILYIEEKEEAKDKEDEDWVENLDRQIEEAIDFFEGKTVSYKTKISTGTVSSQARIVVRLRLDITIENIKTDRNRKYKIKFYLYLICAEDSDIEGIPEISINSDSGEECVIGKFIE